MDENIEARLKEIYTALESPKMAEEENWMDATKLVCEGYKLVKDYDSIENTDLEFEPKKYFTEQLTRYMNGTRSNPYTRRIILIEFGT